MIYAWQFNYPQTSTMIVLIIDHQAEIQDAHQISSRGCNLIATYIDCRFPVFFILIEYFLDMIRVGSFINIEDLLPIKILGLLRLCFNNPKSYRAPNNTPRGPGSPFPTGNFMPQFKISKYPINGAIRKFLYDIFFA